jgi:DNA-binding NarL/FixJ family response regulator
MAEKSSSKIEDKDLLRQPYRILIADEHEAIRQGVRSFLEGREGWLIVGEAADGRDALRLVNETKPDITVLAYALPLMSGLELTRAIKGELPHAEVLIYTMHDQESIVFDVLRAGARGYVLKSDDASHLVAAVEALAKGRPYFSPIVSQAMVDHVVERNDGKGPPGPLTSREREIVELIAAGKLNKQVAHLLDISIKTVETHRAAVMQKLNFHTTAQLVRYAVRNAIVQL